MSFSKADLIDKLKMELYVLEEGGYEPSVREPHRLPRIFRDSVSCPNLGLAVKKEPCTSCYLMEFVPSEHRNEEDACHHIPLNQKGETIASLSAGDRAHMYEALDTWLHNTITSLEQGAHGVGEPAGRRQQFLLSAGNGEAFLPMRVM